MAELALAEVERDQLQGWVRRRKPAQDLTLRSLAVLECVTGASNSEVSRRLTVSLPTVWKWRSRFLEQRLGELVVEPRLGRPVLVSVDREDAVAYFLVISTRVLMETSLSTMTPSASCP